MFIFQFPAIMGFLRDMLSRSPSTSLQRTSAATIALVMVLME